MPNWKKLITSGSNAVLNSVTASNGFFGTASWAVSASRALTASYALNATGGTPGGANTQIQFNSGGFFSGSTRFTFDYVNATVTLNSTGSATNNLYVAADGTDGAFLGSGLYSANENGLYSANGDQIIAVASMTDNQYKYSNNQYIYDANLSVHQLTGSVQTSGSVVGITGSLSVNPSPLYSSRLYYDYIQGYLLHGASTTAGAEGAFAQGNATIANAGYSHTQGVGTETNNTYAHAEGHYTIANGTAAHAEGHYTTANGNYAHAEGSYTDAIGRYSHAEGTSFLINYTVEVFMNALTNVAFDFDSYAVISSNADQIVVAGDQTGASTWPHTVTALILDDGTNQIDVNFLHFTGAIIVTNATYNGGTNETTFSLSGALESYYEAVGNIILTANANYSHAEGFGTTTDGVASHAEGYATVASGDYSHTEGYLTTATNMYAHAEGKGSSASGEGSHAEGTSTSAVGAYAHSEGRGTLAVGDYSHAEGSSSIAIGIGSHASGLHTIASGSFQTTLGQYNKLNNTTDLFVIGNGTSNASRSDIVNVSTNSITMSGSVNISGSLLVNGTAPGGGATFPFTGSAAITGSLTVTGSFTVFTGSAVEFQVTNTGTKLGSTSTDVHQVTGSLRVTGSLLINNSPVSPATTVFMYYNFS